MSHRAARNQNPLRTRARALKALSGLTYQQCEGHLRLKGGEALELAQRYAWPVKRADAWLLDKYLDAEYRAAAELGVHVGEQDCENCLRRFFVALDKKGEPVGTPSLERCPDCDVRPDVDYDDADVDEPAEAPPATSPSVMVERLHRLSPADALRFVDEKLGPPTSWPSPLVSYRLESEFQADWKAEVGQWLKAAEQFGFLDKVVHWITTAAKRPVKGQGDAIDPNDRAHLKLHHHLAAARVVHYLAATGWAFRGFETETGGAVDIDCALDAPSGEPVEFQVKAPDRPGRVAGYRLVDGERDEDVLRAVDKAAKQLRRPAAGHAFVAVCANRGWSLAYRPGCLVIHLIGRTCTVGRREYIDRERRGLFFDPSWRHVSGIVLLDLLRGLNDQLEDEAKYTCTVLLNPNAEFPADPAWFPHARVCILDGDAFRWVRGEPEKGTLPEGTQLVDELPG